MNGQTKRPDEGSDHSDNSDDGPVENQAAEESQPAVEASDDMSAAVSDDDPCEIQPQSSVEELQAKADENWDRYLRIAAELENVRKRAGRDVENAHKFALERFSKELLAVKDSLEMGLATENPSVESLHEGSTATLKLLTTTLQQFGIQEVDPEGEPFDPEFHEAIRMQPSDTAEPGSVLAVVQKGYSLNGRLLRPAMVVVAAD